MDYKNHLQNEQTSLREGEHSDTLGFPFSNWWELESVSFTSVLFSVKCDSVACCHIMVPMFGTRSSCTFTFVPARTAPQKPEDKITAPQGAGQVTLCFDTVLMGFQPCFFPAELIWWMQEILLAGFFGYLGAFWYFSDYQDSVVM